MIPEDTNSENAQALANAGSPDAPMPHWFDAEKHVIGAFGIHDITSGAVLDPDDGLPQSGPLRAQWLADAAAATAPAPSRRRAATTEAGE